MTISHKWYLAHTNPSAIRNEDKEHLLEDHLRCVGKRAADFADSFGSADWARVRQYRG